jgi:hypothetical protein
VRARGVAGELRAGYHVAAWLGLWGLSVRDDVIPVGEWACDAEVLARDDYWLEHGGPITLVLEVGPRIWKWRDVGIEDDGTKLRINGTGRPEVE